MGEIIFFDDRIGPDRLHQAFLVEHDVVMLDQVEERLKNPRRQGNRRARTRQKAFRGIQAKIAELVNVRRGAFIAGFRKIQKNSAVY